ncbi:MAG: glycosyltransferase family 2 protein [Nitrososphaeraceae archaeon]|nr:glycosyltransferase family 2 protein [Nitrososphaeraceae archaeon]
MSIKRMSIIIVNYRTPELVVNCIDSLNHYNLNIDVELIVVDNDSSDGSKEKVTSKFKDVKWIQNESNLGFGKANNLGIGKASNDIVLLLNSDVIANEFFLENMIDLFTNDSENIGLATCQMINVDGTFQKSCTKFNASFKELLSYNLLLDKIGFNKYKGKEGIKAVFGACLIFSKNRIKHLGFFDEDFFMYSEEFELCNRLTKVGFDLKVYDPQIVHLDGASSNNSDWKIRQRLVSQALLFKKNRGLMGFVLYTILTFFNFTTNITLMWFIDNNYRRDFIHQKKLAFQNILCYPQIFFNLYPRPFKVRF